jgi:hypothetical protein
MNLVMFYLQPNHYGSAMRHKWLTMPHGCLGSIDWNAPSRCFVLVSTARQVTPQGHQHTRHCTTGEFKMKVSLSTQIQTRFPNTFETPKRQRVGASLCQHAIRAQPNHKLGGSSPALIGPQSGFSDCSHIVPTPNWRWLRHHTNISPRRSPHIALLRQNKGEKVSGHLHDPDGLWQFCVLSSLPKTRSLKEGLNLITTQPVRHHWRQRTSVLWLNWSGILFEATWKLSASTECFCNSSQEN